MVTSFKKLIDLHAAIGEKNSPDKYKKSELYFSKFS